MEVDEVSVQLQNAGLLWHELEIVGFACPKHQVCLATFSEVQG